MTRESTDIEVEVVEIDGIKPIAHEPLAENSPQPQGGSQSWRKYSGVISSLDNRWWPLWVILGIVALALFLTVGLVLAVIFVIVSLLVKLLRAILG